MERLLTTTVFYIWYISLLMKFPACQQVIILSPLSRASPGAIILLLIDAPVMDYGKEARGKAGAGIITLEDRLMEYFAPGRDRGQALCWEGFGCSEAKRRKAVTFSPV